MVTSASPTRSGRAARPSPPRFCSARSGFAVLAPFARGSTRVGARAGASVVTTSAGGVVLVLVLNATFSYNRAAFVAPVIALVGVLGANDPGANRRIADRWAHRPGRLDRLPRLSEQRLLGEPDHHELEGTHRPHRTRESEQGDSDLYECSAVLRLPPRSDRLRRVAPRSASRCWLRSCIRSRRWARRSDPIVAQRSSTT